MHTYMHAYIQAKMDQVFKYQAEVIVIEDDEDIKHKRKAITTIMGKEIKRYVLQSI